MVKSDLLIGYQRPLPTAPIIFSSAVFSVPGVYDF